MPWFEFQNTQLPGLQIAQHQRKSDTRGFFERLMCLDEFQPVLKHRSIVQMNRSMTEQKGSVRGMHFQHPPHAEMKIVTCIKGAVFDVAVDLRQESPTFLQWQSCDLTAENGKYFCIPEGFAHGFQTLTPDCELLYWHTHAYRADHEGGINPQDPKLNIAWPLRITSISDRDSGAKFLGHEFQGI